MKKSLLKFAKFLIAIILLVIVGVYFFINSLKPTYEGSEELNGLTAQTTVKFDDYGVPHIYAENEEDAMRSLGYVHAQDRLWQMEILRRIAPGRLSEMFGDKTIKNDKFFAGLGIVEYSKKTVENLDRNDRSYKMSMAYLDGINQFIEEGATPIEFHILGLEKKKFDLVDTYNIFGYMSFSFAMAHKTDPVLSMIQSKLGDDYLNELGIEIPTNTTHIKNFNQNTIEISVAINQVLKQSPFSGFIGSNSWVVDGEKSSSGEVLFSNDPHMGFSSPGVWYEAHITTPSFESYGYYLGGVPFPLLSHNREYAYGLTMFENDDISFYQETNVDNDDLKYLFKGEEKSYQITEKTIKVRDGEDVSLTIKSSIHGPIMNELIKTIDIENPVAMNWIYTKKPNQLLKALYNMSRADGIDSFKKYASLIHAPGLNVMYGDAKGNIAWWATAQLYKFPEGTNSKLILDGANGEHEIVEYLDFYKNPQAINPPWHYVYSANNQPDSIANMLYPGYYLPEDRARRIVELLEPKNDWSKADFKGMLLDTKSSVAEELIEIIAENVEGSLATDTEKAAFILLKQWDGDYNKESVAATIYLKYTYQFFINTFRDEIGEAVFKGFMNTHIMERMLAEQHHKEESIWWDDISTTAKEDKKTILIKSFSEAVIALENQLGPDLNSWTWNRVHTLKHPHPLGTVAILDRLFKFNVGPFEIHGSKEVINNLQFDIDESGLYKTAAGPSTRRIVDFADVENSMSILPTGNSGNPFSPHYRDQANMYVNGEYRKMKMNAEEIERVSTKLIFNPK
ncbi:MAG: penicillin acylase family protein [Urechidicola sp.]|nr:penicillin acylase family protein [Urechidicola sp.]